MTLHSPRLGLLSVAVPASLGNHGFVLCPHPSIWARYTNCCGKLATDATGPSVFAEISHASFHTYGSLHVCIRVAVRAARVTSQGLVAWAPGMCVSPHTRRTQGTRAWAQQVWLGEQWCSWDFSADPEEGGAPGEQGLLLQEQLGFMLKKNL